MEILTLTIGFVVGSFTGAASTYLGNKYTDKRRNNELIKIADKKWKDLYKRFPAIIDEMKLDINNPDFSNVREFFVKSSGTSINFKGSFFEYHTDKHIDLASAVFSLRDLGYVLDESSNKLPKYRFAESMIDRLKTH